MPMNYAIRDRNILIQGGAHSDEEVLEALKDVDLSSTIALGEKVLSSKPLRLSALAMGNIDQKTASETLDEIKAGIPGASDGLVAGSKDSGHIDRIMASILQSTAYSELRTQRQLGYVVNAGSMQ